MKKWFVAIAFMMPIWLGGVESPPQESIAKPLEPHRVLYLLQAGKIEEGIKLYRDYYEKTKRHDLELVQQIGLLLLDLGYNSSEPEIQLLTIFGAGISLNEKAMYILQEGIKSPHPQLQLISLNFLSHYQNDQADAAINKAINSNYLIIRLECIHHLCQKKASTAVGQAEALMSKVNEKLLPLFPQFFAMTGTADAMRTLRRMLSHKDVKVRMAAILSAAKYGRDDMLPSIRTLASQHLIMQQEACAMALGVLKDEKSVALLEKISQSGSATVRMAALQALYRLGRHEVHSEIEKAAQAGDVYAIHILADIPDSENVLYELTKSNNTQICINAALALLERKDVRCLKPLCNVLVKDSRDLAFTKVSSAGNALKAYKAIPSARQNLSDDVTSLEVSLNIREDAIIKSLELPEEAFLLLADRLFELKQNDLVPVLVDSLEQLQTPGAIALLKKHQQKAGAPLIRNYCNLALFRLKEEGPYAENVYAWISNQHKEELIQFRPFLASEMHAKSYSYQLTPQETSRLLIGSFDALAKSQDDAGIDVLLHAIQHGNEHNKFALAGLLIRVAQ